MNRYSVGGWACALVLLGGCGARQASAPREMENTAERPAKFAARDGAMMASPVAEAPMEDAPMVAGALSSAEEVAENEAASALDVRIFEEFLDVIREGGSIRLKVAA